MKRLLMPWIALILCASCGDDAKGVTNSWQRSNSANSENAANASNNANNTNAQNATNNANSETCFEYCVEGLIRCEGDVLMRCELDAQGCNSWTITKDCAAEGSSCNAESQACEAPTSSCEDQVQNGDESGIDCGGSCAPCDDALACSLFGAQTEREFVNDGVGSGSIAVFNPMLGEYLLAWAQRPVEGANVDFRVETMRISRDGQAVGSSRRELVPDATVSQAMPRLVATNDGWAAVYRNDSMPRTIQLARVDANGTLLSGYPKRVDHGSGGASDSAALAYNPADDTMLAAWLAWEGDPNDSDVRTYVAPVGADGVVDHTKRTLLNTQARDSVNFAKRGNHALAFDGTSYAFVYTDFLENGTQEVWVAFFDTAGALVNKFKLPSAEGSMTTVAAADGDFGVTWRTEDQEIWFGRLATNGNMGTPVRMSGSGLDYVDQPSIVTDGADGFRVVWNQKNTSGAPDEIWMAAVDGDDAVTGPSALVQRTTPIWMPTATYDGCQTVIAIQEPFSQTTPIDLVWVP